MPQPDLKTTSSDVDDLCEKPARCSCKEIEARRHRCALSTFPLDFRVIIYSDEGLKNFFMDFACFASLRRDTTLSTECQEELLNKLRQHCYCDQAIAQGAILLHPKASRKRSSDANEDLERESKRHKIDSFHHVHRVSPFALLLRMRYSLPGARQRVIDRSICDLLKQNARGPKSGRIYIMHQQGIPAYLKIGFTKSDYSAKRYLEQKPCHSDLALLKETTTIPFPQRVEQLIFKELSLHRRYQDCGVCGKEHTEWFEISLEKAERVIQRWSNWMNTNPYGASKKLENFWKKRVSMRLDKLGQVMSPEEIAARYISDANAATAEERLAKELDKFTRSGFDPNCNSAPMEWCFRTQAAPSTPC